MFLFIALYISDFLLRMNSFSFSIKYYLPLATEIETGIYKSVETFKTLLWGALHVVP